MKPLVVTLILLLVAALGVGIFIAVQVNEAETDRKIAACQEGKSPVDPLYHMCAIRNGR